MNIGRKLALATCILGAMAAFADPTGSSERSAVTISVGGSKTVSLVHIYDEGEETEFGGYYFKLAMRRGDECTVKVSGSYDTASADVSFDAADFPEAGFNSYDVGNDTYLCLSGWGEEDPSSVTFFVFVDGDPGNKVTVSVESGYSLPKGIDDNPQKITFKETVEETSATKYKTLGGRYVFEAELEAGRKYYLGTTGGKDGDAHELAISVPKADDPDYATRPYDRGFILYPTSSGTVTFNVLTESVESDDTSFGLRYQAVPARAITDKSRTLQGVEPGGSVVVEPGYLNRPDSGYYDGIADEALVAIDLTAGDSYLFETTGAETNIVLRIYKPDGSTGIGDVNTTKGGGSFDTRLAYTASVSGRHYVGVYEAATTNELAGAVPTYCPVTLSADQVEVVVDDPFAVVPVPVARAENPSPETAGGEPAGPLTLDRTHWVQALDLGVSKGVTYRLKAVVADQSETGGLVLSTMVKKVNGSSETATAGRTSTSGVLSSEAGLVIEAEENATYRITVSVSNGRGLDYPDFLVYATAYASKGTADLGILNVTMKGYDSTWSLDSDSTKRLPGVPVLVPAGVHTVKFTKVNGFSQPYGSAGFKCEVKAGNVVTEVVGEYSDTFDPVDDGFAGKSDDGTVTYKPTVISPATTVATANRTLFTGDPRDVFAFSAKEGYYYDFGLASMVGDVVLMLTNSQAGVVFDDMTVVSHLQLPAVKDSTYYLVAKHGEELVDSSYTLCHSCANVGAIKFAKTAVGVKENASYVDLSVSRTGKDGRVRVRYGTVAGTAEPGKDYYPQNGVLEWEANDNKAKTIRIRLIPDVTPAWEENKSFSVNLLPVDEADLEDDEYPAQIVTQSATVSISEVSRKTPGSIALVSYDGGSGSVKVKDAKKPVAEVAAGEAISLSFARTGGCNGIVGVRVETIKGTANKSGETDYSPVVTNLVWNDDDISTKTVEVATYGAEESGSFDVTRVFSVKLTALTGKTGDGTQYEKPTLTASSVTVNIANDIVLQTLETYAKSLPKAGGVTVKGSKTGAWFFDDNGALRSRKMLANEKLEVSFSLTGPGFFMAVPTVVDDAGTAYITAVAGKEDLGNVTDQDVPIVVPAGATTVKFTVQAGSKADWDGNECYCEFTPIDGMPYFWVPLSALTPSPSDKGVVILGGSSAVRLSIDASEDAASNGLLYRFTLADDAKKLGTEAALFSLVTDETFADVPTELLANGAKYVWRVDFAYDTSITGDGEPNWVSPKSAWTFETAVAGAPETVVLPNADGSQVAVSDDGFVELMQCVKATIAFGATNVESALSYKIVSGKFPDGMKFDAKTGVATGVPTKSGDYAVVVQSIVASSKPAVAGSTVAVAFRVAPITLAVGTFNGVLREDGNSLTNGLPAVAPIAVTVTSAGKISAKVSLAGKSYSFAASGFDEIVDKIAEGDEEDDYTKLFATLDLVQKIGTTTCTNTLELTINDSAVANETLLGLPIGTATLVMNVPDANNKGYQEEIRYVCDLHRDNGKVEAVVDAIADYVGYYTVALTPSGESIEAPTGNGYLTLTVAKDAKVKVAGVLADGTKVSGSAVGGFVGAITHEIGVIDSSFVIPFAAVKSPYCFGGEIVLKMEQDDDGNVTPVVASENFLVWNNDNAALTQEGERGWTETLVPAGGWYDTTINLQGYYLNYEFELDAGADLPDEVLPAGYSFAADCIPAGMSVNVAGDAVSVDKKSLVKVAGSKTLNDLAASVNPWNVSLSFKRATGIVSGSFSIWTEGTDSKGNPVQKEITGLKHEGVLILSRSAESPLADDVWTAGYFLIPVTVKEGGKTRKWSASLPFNIRAVDQGEIDWWADDWGEQ